MLFKFHGPRAAEGAKMSAHLERLGNAITTTDPTQSGLDRKSVMSLLVKERLDNEVAGLEAARRQLSKDWIVRIIV